MGDGWTLHQCVNPSSVYSPFCSGSLIAFLACAGSLANGTLPRKSPMCLRSLAPGEDAGTHVGAPDRVCPSTPTPDFLAGVEGKYPTSVDILASRTPAAEGSHLCG